MKNTMYVMTGQYVEIKNKVKYPFNYIATAISKLFGTPKSYYRIGTRDDNKSYWDEMKAGNYVAIGWPALGDLNKYNDKSKGTFRSNIKEALKEKYPSRPQSIGKSASQIVYFYYDIKIGDIVVACDGERVLAIGKVTGEYEYKADLGFPNCHSVEWLSLINSKVKINECLQTSTWKYEDIDNIIKIQSLIYKGLEDKKEILCSKGVLTELKGINLEINNILERKRQVILYGPPGTGKTYNAERAARELCARSEYNKSFDSLNLEEKEIIIGSKNIKGLVRMCCFHPSYGYEDFIEGIKPSIVNNQTIFKLQNGIFKELCKDARENPNKKFYLIIDEINRGDISRIFGELIMIIETNKRNKEVLLPISNEYFSVPENAYIIGTMNTADKSISFLDVALRRRFGFLELLPDYSLLESVIYDELPLKAYVKELNKRICENIGQDARNLQIGHSYFLENEKPVKEFSKFSRILKEDIIPLVEEYSYGDYSVIGKILGDGIIDVKNQIVNYGLFEAENELELINAILTPCPQIRITKDDQGTDTDINLIDNENIDEAGEQCDNSEVIDNHFKNR